MEKGPSKLILVAGILLLVVGIVAFFKTKKQEWIPDFLSQASLYSIQEETNEGDNWQEVQNHPFWVSNGPNSRRMLSTNGVHWKDFVVPDSFEAVDKKAQAELRGFAKSMSAGPHSPGKVLAKDMDIQYVKDTQAITIFRVPDGTGTRVRVWSRTPSAFGDMF